MDASEITIVGLAIGAVSAFFTGIASMINATLSERRKRRWEIEDCERREKEAERKEKVLHAKLDSNIALTKENGVMAESAHRDIERRITELNK